MLKNIDILMARFARGGFVRVSTEISSQKELL